MRRHRGNPVGRIGSSIPMTLRRSLSCCGTNCGAEELKFERYWINSRGTPQKKTEGFTIFSVRGALGSYEIGSIAKHAFPYGSASDVHLHSALLSSRGRQQITLNPAVDPHYTRSKCLRYRRHFKNTATAEQLPLGVP